MSAVLEAKTAMRNLAKKAQEVVVDDSLTQAEKMTTLDQIEADIKTHSDTVALHEKAKRLAQGGEVADDEKGDDDGKMLRPKSFAKRIVESDAYKSMRETIAGSARGGSFVELEEGFNPSFGTKAAATIDEGTVPAFSGGSGLGGQLVAPQFLPGIVPLKFQRLTIADLLASGTTDTAAVTYVIEAAFQDLTAAVAEKGAKPQLDLTLARRQDNVGKIANRAKVTDELFEDASQFVSYLQGRMIFGVQRAEENQLLNGNGTAPNILGLMNRPGLAPAVVTAAGLTATKVVEGVFNQITNLRAVSFVEPDAFVIHPNDWQTIQLGKDGNGQYFGGGPIAGQYGNGGYTNQARLWGLPGVITTAIAQGTVLVGGFQECAQVFRRRGVTVEMTNSNEDDFNNNLISLRAEERLALAVYRPAGLGKVTLTA